MNTNTIQCSDYYEDETGMRDCDICGKSYDFVANEQECCNDCIDDYLNKERQQLEIASYLAKSLAPSEIRLTKTHIHLLITNNGIDNVKIITISNINIAYNTDNNMRPKILSCTYANSNHVISQFTKMTGGVL